MRVEKEQDGEVVRWSWGVWLACVAHAIVMMILSQFAYTTAMIFWRVLNLIFLTSCAFLWKATEGRKVARSFALTVGILSAVILSLSLIPNGVTEWG